MGIKLIIYMFFLFISINTRINAQTIIYYDPDGNLRRIVDLNAEGNKIFSPLGIKFLIAADENSFSNAIKQYNPEFYLLNSLIYQNYKKNLNLDIAFILGKNNNYSYKKRLVTFQEDISLDNIKNKVVATTFKNIYEIIPLETKILKVPKDLDAILAIKFKQAEVAIVSENSLEIFKSISPVDYNLLKTIYITKEIYNPLFCYVIGNNNISKIKEIENILMSQNSKNFFSLLMYDSIINNSKILSKIK